MTPIETLLTRFFDPAGDSTRQVNPPVALEDPYDLRKA